MGVVYRATRVDGEFDQTVAIKLIKRGMDTDAILKRFRRERQITAALNHPNIAYFFGGGSTDDGLPYFVMEYVVGEPLYQYCDAKRLDTRGRLELFRQICWAVEAAHSSGIIHRDLKPSNVMVKPDGKPKLLDFGIAKVLDPSFAGDDTEPTLTGRGIMTPEYASPEQLEGSDVGKASDVYSLGVILFELLTGHRPFTIRRRVSVDGIEHIETTEATRPSDIVSREDRLLPSSADSETASLEQVLESRRSSVDKLRQELSGDLDKIILKSLRRNPSERYRSATEIADDITNFLEDRPVSAELFTTSSYRIEYPGRSGSGSTTVAILPFRTIGGTAETTGSEFLGIGLADGLISRLSGVSRLTIRPTTSVLPFGDSDPFDAGRRVAVQFVLDGSVRRAGDRIRVSVQFWKLRRKQHAGRKLSMKT